MLIGENQHSSIIQFYFDVFSSLCRVCSLGVAPSEMCFSLMKTQEAFKPSPFILSSSPQFASFTASPARSSSSHFIFYLLLTVSFSVIVHRCPAGIPLVLAGMLVSFSARLLYN